ncbi:MAG: hypothetical protein KDA51_05525, partial [Planctomycetales bacterium]|nr:hypothetical protein [Planctomycetales bacterium]
MGVDWYKLIASNFITRYWPLVIGGWIALAVALRAIAPAWSDIAADGDLAFLPPTVPSAVGQRQLVEAFPSMSARSAMVMVIANRDAPLGLGDLAMAMDVARRLHWVAARNILDKLPETEPESDSQGNSTDNPPASLAENAQASLERNIAAESAIDNLTEAIEIEEILGRYL